MVVQPGVEFGDDFVLDYNPAAARALASFSETMPFVFEAHSTDYQMRDNLRALVRDHFAILKVGPALTFAFQEAVFALAMVENELVPAEKHSNLVDVDENTMIHQPEHWQKYYHGDEMAQHLAHKFSLSDRLRYHWVNPVVQGVLTKMLSNLESVTIPLSLLSQYAPLVSKQIRMGKLPNRPAIVIDASIQVVLDYYRL